MKTIATMFALALALSAPGCSKKSSDSDSKETKEKQKEKGKAGQGAGSGFGKLVPYSFKTKEISGTIMAPKGATHKASFGDVVIRAGKFAVKLSTGKADLKKRLAFWKKNKVNKLQKVLVNSPAAILIQSKVMGMEYHLTTVINKGDGFTCANNPGVNTPKTEAAARALLKACQSFKPKAGAKLKLARIRLKSWAIALALPKGTKLSSFEKGGQLPGNATFATEKVCGSDLEIYRHPKKSFKPMYKMHTKTVDHKGKPKKGFKLLINKQTKDSYRVVSLTKLPLDGKRYDINTGIIIGRKLYMCGAKMGVEKKNHLNCIYQLCTSIKDSPKKKK